MIDRWIDKQTDRQMNEGKKINKREKESTDRQRENAKMRKKERKQEEWEESRKTMKDNNGKKT